MRGRDAKLINFERVPRLLQVLQSETPAESPMSMDDEVGPVSFVPRVPYALSYALCSILIF